MEPRRESLSFSANVPVCRSKNPKNKRLRASVWIQTRKKSFLIDTSIDLREQALVSKIPWIDAVLYTHPHTDHMSGIDELRSFNYIQKAEIPVYGNAWTCSELNARFPYIFKPAVIEGGGIPRLKIHQIETSAPYFEVQGEKIIPLSLSHGSKECVGYRMHSFAYVTDCHYIPPSTLDRMKDLSVLILDCVRLKHHDTHLNLEEALKIVSLLRPKKTFLTHLGHDFDYVKSSKMLPKGVHFAYDGLTLQIEEGNQK